MKIAVLSGKGGTGKTTISASLAYSLRNSQYVDCDVEEPNGNIFLKASLTEKEVVTVLNPVVNDDLCTGCGDCQQACQFNAIVVINKKVMIFDNICHSCGACKIACPTGAISEVPREIGVIEYNSSNTFMQGKLNLNEPLTVPVILQLKRKMNKHGNVIIDSAPGASCTVVSTIEDSDYCVLVTEPTPFGLHDLKIAIDLVKQLKLPFGVVINKAMDSDKSIQIFCKEQNIDILMELPYSKEIAQNYSKGILPVQYSKHYKEEFVKLLATIKERIK